MYQYEPKNKPNLKCSGVVLPMSVGKHTHTHTHTHTQHHATTLPGIAYT
jgi:hypothetical protein